MVLQGGRAIDPDIDDSVEQTWPRRRRTRRAQVGPKFARGRKAFAPAARADLPAAKF
jgi:hypothetical protein